METFLLTLVFTKSEIRNKTVLKWHRLIFLMYQIVDGRRHLIVVQKTPSQTVG
jgi:hypothetical protein